MIFLIIHVDYVIIRGVYHDHHTHVGKYDRADVRPKLTMLTANVGYWYIGPMIDRGLDVNCGRILACYIGPKIAPNDRPRITARVKPMTFKIYNDINNDNKI